MTEPLNRNDIIDLLNRLGSNRDEDVLEAARQAHAQITDAGVTWDDLLVPDDTAGVGETADDDTAGVGETADDDTAGVGETADDDTGADDTGDDETADDETLDLEDGNGEAPAGKTGNDAESRKLIDELLARPGISADLREELNGYKTDIAGGEFLEADRRYIRALHKRLSKTS